MRTAIRKALDFLVHNPWTIYLISATLSALAIWLLPPALIKKFIDNSFASIPGVSFSLFGFVITAISILASLKGSPFFTLLQRHNPMIWRRVISAFLQEAGLYATFGLFAMILSAKDIAAFKGDALKIASFSYVFLFVSAILVTLSAIYLLRLVANAPVVDDTQPTPTNTAALQGFQDPTSQQPPRRV